MSEALADRPEQPEVLSTERVFDGKVWDVDRDTFAFHGDELVREVVRHPGAVAILALDDEDRVVLVQQYRHPVAAHEWELPAGLLDIAGEDPLEAARRELAEEVDLVADTWNVLVDHRPSPGGMDEALRIYLARDLRDVADDERFEREGEEAQMQRRSVPLDEVVDAVLEGRIHNGTLMVGLLAVRELRARGWAGLRPADVRFDIHPRVGD
ncbi:NUDIX domain-containing protein [Janibacter massiliensis]|uniref:NUDIX domain-containing protein n=1 Tax=Janibacter massiliensis TaxID=2058291 RepID=UPI000D101554|nr:NUDIX hydrolase [Janibacter massiliensis]